MDYENIVEVIELNNYFKVNEYLKCGWILLSASVSVAPYGNEGNVEQSIYALGWSKKMVRYSIQLRKQMMISGTFQKLRTNREMIL